MATQVVVRAPLVCCLLLLLVVGPAAAIQDDRPPPRPGLSVGLADAPSDPVDPRARSFIVADVTPGATIERVIDVGNGEDDPMPVALYIADATATDEWRLEPGRGQGDLATWSTVTPSSTTIAPGTRSRVTLRIDVPSDATPGERTGAVVAEMQQAQATATGAVAGRVGVRIYLNVAGPEAPELVTDFTIDTLQAVRTDDGAPAVLIGVTNTGDRIIDVIGRLTLRDGPGGVTAGPFPVSIGRTLGPGFSGDVIVGMEPDLPAGPWLAVASLASGEVQRRAQAVIRFPDEPGTSADQVPASPYEEQRRILLPLASLLFGLALGGWVLFAVLRRGGDDRTDADRVPMLVDEGR